MKYSSSLFRARTLTGIVTVLGGQPRLQEPLPHLQNSDSKVIHQNYSIFDVSTLRLLY